MGAGKPPSRFGGGLLPDDPPARDDDLPVVDHKRLSRFGAGLTSSEIGIAEVSYRAAAQIDATAGLGASEDAELSGSKVTGLAQFDAAPSYEGDGAATLQVHGTAVAVGERAALFVGHSGAGKSATALSMMAAGARLIADDQVLICAEDGRLVLRAVEGFEGMIEARGIGLLRVDAVEVAELAVVVDLDRTELHRLPPARTHEILTKQVHLVLGRENWSLEPALLALLAGRIVSPQDP